MPKKREIQVNVIYREASNEESEKILNIAKNWHVEEFMKWFEQHLNQLSIENQKAKGVADKDINEHVYDNYFR